MNIENYINQSKVEKTISIYLRAKRMLAYRDFGVYGLNEYMDNCSEESLKNTIDYVEFILSRLNNIEREIIQNDIIDKNYNNWWLSKYSKSSYYRNKNDALAKFVQILGQTNSASEMLN